MRLEEFESDIEIRASVWRRKEKSVLRGCQVQRPAAAAQGRANNPTGQRAS